MKKTVAFTLCLALLLCVFSMPAFAVESETFTIPEGSFRISIPEPYLVLTRDTPPDDPAFTALGIDPEYMIRFFENGNIFLDAVDPSGASEIVITILESSLDDYTRLSNAALSMMPALLNDSLSAAGVTVSDSSVVESGEGKYLRFEFSRPDVTGTVYGIMFNTVLNGNAISYTLTSFSGPIAPELTEMFEAIVAGISYLAPDAAPPAAEGGAFVYRDEATGASFTVPDGWEQAPFSTDRKYLTAKFVSQRQAGLSILYMGQDLWGISSPVEQMLLPRERMNMDYFSLQDWAELAASMGGTDVSFVTYGENQYVQFDLAASASQYGVDFSAVLRCCACIRNGYLIMFQFPAEEDAASLADCEALMASLTMD